MYIYKITWKGVNVTFISNNRQHFPMYAKIISFWVGKVLSIAKADKSPVIMQSTVVMAVGVSLMSNLQAVHWARSSTPVRHYFSIYIVTTGKYQDSVQ